MTRHLAYAQPDLRPDILVLCDDDGNQVVRYESWERSFRRIQHDGRWYALGGRDRDTRELVYWRMF